MLAWFGNVALLGLDWETWPDGTCVNSGVTPWEKED